MNITIIYTKTGKEMTLWDFESVRFYDGNLTIVFKDGGFLRLFNNETPFSFQIF